MTVVAVVVVALVVALGALALSAVLGRETALDTARQERWLVDHAPRRFRGMLRAADRRVAGGAVAGLAWAVVFVGAVLVGWVFESIGTNRGLARWDAAGARWGVEHADAALLDGLAVLTHLGDATVLGLGIMTVAAVAWRRHRWGAVGYLAAVGIGVFLLNSSLKLIVDRQRPQFMQIAEPHGASFPSGHASAAAACWAAMMLVLFARSSGRGRLVGAVIAVALALTVAATRVLLGVHWVTDVIAGVVVGWVWFLLVTVVFGGRLLDLGEPITRLDTDEPPSPVAA